MYKRQVKERLNNKSLNFIETDVLNLKLERTFDIWHDRAVFHFITNKKSVEKIFPFVMNILAKEEN